MMAPPAKTRISTRYSCGAWRNSRLPATAATTRNSAVPSQIANIRPRGQPIARMPLAPLAPSGHVGEEDGRGEARDVPEAGADQSHTQCEILRHAVQGGRGQKADAALIAPSVVDEIVDEGESPRSDHQRQSRRGQAYEFLSGHDQFENCGEHQCPAARGEDKPFGTVTEATVERPQCAKHKRNGDGSGDGKQGHEMCPHWGMAAGIGKARAAFLLPTSLSLRPGFPA